MDDIRPPRRAGINKSAPTLDAPQPRPQTRNFLPPDPPEDKPEVEPKHQPPNSMNTPKKSRFSYLKFKHTKLSRKQWALFGLLVVILLSAGVLAGRAIYQHYSKVPPLVNTHIIPPPPKVEPSRLTGLPVDPELNKRPVTGIMIENSPDARPQSGLRDAGVVYEAIAEGGITRFLALYQEAQPSYIGPVRSIRPYYIDFALPFQAAVAHVGGSPEGLADARALHLRDLDQFANPGAYWRITQRYAPHNMYTSMAKLDALKKSKGFTKSDFTGFPRKKDTPAKTPVARTIDFSISGYYYSVHYVYDAKTNSYLRSEGGQPHKDEKSKKQLNPKVVIAPVMSYGIESDGKHSDYGTTGSGAVYVFQDGNVIQGVWHKASRGAQITFTDTNGQPIKLNAGQTWISLVGSRSDVSYKP